MSVDQDQNPDPDIVEYTLTGLDNDKAYFISVTVYTNDDTPIESDYSNEVALSPITLPQRGGGGGEGGCFLDALEF
jgi:hypothetical protein